MVQLTNRLDRLERHHAVGRRVCAECGAQIGVGAGCIRRLAYVMPLAANEADDLGPERCPACGRLLVLRLTFEIPRNPGATLIDDAALR